MRSMKKRLVKRLLQHFADDDLPSPSLIHELATICQAVIVEQLAVVRKRTVRKARKAGRK